jgi:hypothetical protein
MWRKKKFQNKVRMKYYKYGWNEKRWTFQSKCLEILRNNLVLKL